MSIPNTSEKSVDLDRQENITKGNISAKKVSLYTYDGSSDTLISNNSKPLGSQLLSGDVGLITNTTIHGLTTGGGGGGGYVDVKVTPSGALVTDTTISGTVAVSSPTYKTRIDDTTTAGITYVGKAAIGTAESAASWQISKIDETGSETIITWSGSGFTAIWNNRTSISYT